MRPAFEVAEEIDPGCDSVLGSCVATEDRLTLVKELRALAFNAAFDLERISIENAANWLEHEIVKSGNVRSENVMLPGLGGDQPGRPHPWAPCPRYGEHGHVTPKPAEATAPEERHRWYEPQPAKDGT
jgi:hypothetical protein